MELKSLMIAVLTGFFVTISYGQSVEEEETSGEKLYYATFGKFSVSSKNDKPPHDFRVAVVNNDLSIHEQLEELEFRHGVGVTWPMHGTRDAVLKLERENLLPRGTFKHAPVIDIEVFCCSKQGEHTISVIVKTAFGLSWILRSMQEVREGVHEQIRLMDDSEKIDYGLLYLEGTYPLLLELIDTAMKLAEEKRPLSTDGIY